MSDLVVVAFPDEATAFQMRAELVALQREYLIEMEDVVVVTRAESGDVTLHQAVNLTAMGAVGGTFWGSLVGLLFLNPLLGAAVGAASGAISGRLTDIGIDDGFLGDVGASLDKGGAAVCVLIRKMTGDKVAERLALMNVKGRIIQTSLGREAEDRLRGSFAPDAPMTAAPDQMGRAAV